MGGDTTKTKAVALCVACGSVYAARVWSDGTVHPIGATTECQCGCSEFEHVSDDVLDFEVSERDDRDGNEDDSESVSRN